MSPNSSSGSSVNWGLWFYSPYLIVQANTTYEIKLSFSSTSLVASKYGENLEEEDDITSPFYVEITYYDGTKNVDKIEQIVEDGDIDISIDGGNQGVLEQVAVRATSSGPLSQNIFSISSVEFTFQAPSPGENGLYEVGLFDTITSIAKQFDVSIQVLENINSVFADSALKNGVLASSGFVHVPLTSAEYIR